MSTYDEHIARAHHNESLLASLPKGYADWRITISFYAAVHYVEAVLATKNWHSSDHTSRNNYIRTLSQLKPASIDYSTLANSAWIARYRASFNYNDPKNQSEVARICALLESIKKAIGVT